MAQVRDMKNLLLHLDLTNKAALQQFANYKVVDFRTKMIPELLRAVRGDQDSTVTESKSLVEAEMTCFDANENDVCRENYHKLLRAQEYELLEFYFSAMELEKYLHQSGMCPACRTSEVIEERIRVDLADIEDSRNRASCPGFINEELKGGGCQNFSTYRNQTVGLQCQKDHSTPVYYDSDSSKYIPVSSIQCLQNGQWSIDYPGNITCAPDCKQATRMTKLGHFSSHVTPNEGFR